jgi:hypothetical protein
VRLGPEDALALIERAADAEQEVVAPRAVAGR